MYCYILSFGMGCKFENQSLAAYDSIETLPALHLLSSSMWPHLPMPFLAPLCCLNVYGTVSILHNINFVLQETPEPLGLHSGNFQGGKCVKLFFVGELG